MPVYTAMEDPNTAVLLESFQERMDVLNKRLERLKQLDAPLEAPSPPVPPASLLRLPFELRLQILLLLQSTKARH